MVLRSGVPPAAEFFPRAVGPPSCGTPPLLGASIRRTPCCRSLRSAACEQRSARQTRGTPGRLWDGGPPSECEPHRRPCLPQPRASGAKRQRRACFSETSSVPGAEPLYSSSSLPRAVFSPEARRGPTRQPLLAFSSQDLRPGPCTMAGTPSSIPRARLHRLAVRTASCRSRRERFGGPAGGRICVV